MSSVRMCDQCGQIFSEQADGWESGSATRRRYNKETGQYEQQHLTMDKCPDCSSEPVMVPVVKALTMKTAE